MATLRNALIVLLCLVAVRAIAQSRCDCFDRLRNLSRYYGDRGDSAMQLAALKDGISFLEPQQAADYFFELAELYDNRDMSDSAVRYYALAMEHGYDINAIRNIAVVKRGIDKAQIARYDAANRAKIDFRVYEQFISAAAIDQSVRNGTLIPEEQFTGPGAPMDTRLRNDTLFQRADANGYKFVKWVFENHGYPDPYKLGFTPPAFDKILLHITARQNKMAEYVFTKMEEMAAKCEYPTWSAILFMRDRSQYYNGGTSNSGVWRPDEIGKITNLQRADSLRMAYNHLRLKEGVPKDIVLPVTYKPAPYPPGYFCLKKYHIE